MAFHTARDSGSPRIPELVKIWALKEYAFKSSWDLLASRDLEGLYGATSCHGDAEQIMTQSSFFFAWT